MSDTRTLNRSFAGGEVSPELFGRLDLVKFQTGLALCRNMRVLPHGPAVNREGTKLINEVKDSSKRTRLIPFTLSDSSTYVLEFGDQYIRFHTNGGTVVEAAKTITAITKANPGVVTSAAHGFSNGDWVFIDNVVGMTQVNGRFFKVAGVAANTFQLTDTAGNNVDTTSFTAYVSGGTASRVYQIASPYLEADLFGLHYAQATVKLTLTHPSYEPRELVITSPTNWALSTINFNSPSVAPFGVVATATVAVGVGGGSLAHYYVVTSVDADGNESLASAASSCVNNLYTAGNFNLVTWTTNGSFRYRLYRSSSAGQTYGFVGEANGSATPAFVDQNISADFTRNAPTNQTIFASSGNYPRAASYFEQRRVFAGSTNEPQTTWLTRSGSDSNMAQSFPLRDDDPFDFRVAAREANQIKHLVPLDDLLLFTGAAVWRVFSNNNDALTAQTVTFRPTAYIGATDVQPVTTGKAVIFEEARSAHIQEVRYSFESQGVTVNDVSLMAPHLFDGYTARDVSFAPGRLKTVWVTRSDGTMLGMTYIPEQEVTSWHHHDTDGLFESVATVAEGTEDGIYFIVQRTINGRTVRYIERLQTSATVSLVDAFYVDCGKTSLVAGATTITNLHHLEGKVVNILVDGVVHPQRTVTNGAITLATAIVTKAHVGLPITAQLQTLPMAILQASGAGIGSKKNVSQVVLRVFKSSQFWAGATFAKLRQFKQRTTEVYGAPPALYTGIAPVTIDGKWTDDAQVVIQQTDPLPLQVNALALEVSDGD